MTHLSEIDVVIVDAYSLLFRAYYAFPATLTNSDGAPINAAYGFTKILLDAMTRIEPKYLVVAIDMGKPTFRHTAYEGYKANRPPAPPEIISQIPIMIEMLTALRIPTLGIEGFEADDVIGTLATKLPKEYPELEIGIMTGDKDSFQLIQDRVMVLMPGKEKNGGFKLVNAEGVTDILGVRPDQVVDYKALCGDTSDNIPGVKGIGPKTAAQLLHTYGTLEAVLAAAMTEQTELIAPMTAGVQRKIAAEVESAKLSQQLARIDCNVPVEFSLNDATLSQYDKPHAITFFKTLGFESLIKKLPLDTDEALVQATLF